MNIKIFGKVFFVSKFLLAVIITVVSAIFAVSGFLIIKDKDRDKLAYAYPTEYSNILMPANSTEPDEESVLLKVYITGCVNKPGIYDVKKGAFLYEVVEMAGGLTGEAEQESINMVYEILDNVSIKIVSSATGESHVLGNTDAGASVVINSNSGHNSGNAVVNINTADLSELQRLPGIGEAKAADIIKYREEKGLFKRIEDIMNVPGIKEARFNALKGLITC